MTAIEELTKQLAIDEENLPLEHKNQAIRYAALGRLAARATAAQAKAELRLRIFEAKLDLEFRRSVNEKGLLPSGIKMTETALQSSIRAHDAYVLLKTAVIDAEEEAETLGSFLRAFEQRGWALKHLERTAGGHYPGDDDDLLARQAAHRLR